MKKNRPRRSQRKEKTKERAGANTHRPYRRRKQTIDREKPLEKTINEPLIRHDLKYTQSPGRNQPIKGNSHNQHTHRITSTSRSKRRPSSGTRQTTAGNTSDAQAPRSPTRASGADKRDERGNETSGTRGEPQPAEQARADNPEGMSPRIIRHRHVHDDITG